MPKKLNFLSWAIRPVFAEPVTYRDLQRKRKHFFTVKCWNLFLIVILGGGSAPLKPDFVNHITLHVFMQQSNGTTHSKARLLATYSLRVLHNYYQEIKEKDFQFQ